MRLLNIRVCRGQGLGGLQVTFRPGLGFAMLSLNAM